MPWHIPLNQFFVLLKYPNEYIIKVKRVTDRRATGISHLRNTGTSWKPECVGGFNMDWRILVFYPEPEARDKIS
jgi:hypothetical protein